MRIPSRVLHGAAHEVAARWRRDVGDTPGADEVAELLVLLEAAVHQAQGNPDAAIDDRVRSPLGRRLLDLVRVEVVRGWAANGVADAELPPLLLAIEQVREAIEPGWEQSFAARLSGSDGLELLVDVAHDLRSPLTSILFLAETLQRGQSGDVNDVQHRQLGLIYTAALGLSSVASDIIELTRGGNQLVEKEPEPLSVTAVLEAVRDIVRPMAEEKKLAVRLLATTTDERLGHPVALSRVLLNLTTNALKFTDRGYVEIVTQEKGADRVEFAVRDSGKGIDPALVDTLYEPLRRTSRRRGHLFSQTGLGLTICRKLVEAMGSELRVETRSGWGTRFFFELDLPPCPSPQRRRAPTGPRLAP
ncbi:MAG TPA: HAMP domain-containing sensor histidine kinase [Gemmatimonadales bacterium]|nr:HAMP domain-containing sensor histidine kinase [Gemmatimonadales bacterium]